MPCYRSYTYSIDFQAGNQEVLARAVKALGYSFHTDGNGVIHVKTPEGYFSLVGGQATSTNPNVMPNVNKLRVAYAQQAVAYAAQKAGLQRMVTGKNQGVLSRG